jgi:hypothetical protein
MGLVRVDRIIPVRNLDETWGRLDTSCCVSVSGYEASAYYLNCFLHRTRNGRWYEEEWNPKTGASVAKELSLDRAMDWLIENTSDRLNKLKFLEDLPQVDQSPTPPHGGGLVVKCLKCRALSAYASKTKSSTEIAIVKALRKSREPLSARQLADAASLKYNSNFRSMLSRLVGRSIVLKLGMKGPYVLADKDLS